MQCRIWFNKNAKNDKRRVLGPFVTYGCWLHKLLMTSYAHLFLWLCWLQWVLYSVVVITLHCNALQWHHYSYYYAFFGAQHLRLEEGLPQGPYTIAVTTGKTWTRFLWIIRPFGYHVLRNSVWCEKSVVGSTISLCGLCLGCGRQLILVIKKFEPPVVIYGEKLTDR